MIQALLLALAVGGPTAATTARTLATRSIVEYDAGDFDKALADAQQAYELDPHPGLLYNLGQCHRALHHWERAEFYYRGYLRKRPDATNRDAVLALIAEMVAKQKESAAPTGAAPILVEAPPPPVGVATAPPPPTPLPAAPVEAVTEPGAHGPVPIGAWVVGGVGVAALAAGAVFAVLATNLRSQDTAQPASGPWLHSISQGQFNDEVTDAYLGNGFIYGGAAALVAGVLWGVFGRGTASNSSTAPAMGSF